MSQKGSWYKCFQPPNIETVQRKGDNNFVSKSAREETDIRTYQQSQAQSSVCSLSDSGVFFSSG